MNLKVAVAIVAVLVALFVLGVGAGVYGDDGDSKDDNALVDALGSAAGTAAVAREDIVPGCPDDDDPDLLVVPGGLGASCTVVVTNDDDFGWPGSALDPVVVQAPAPEGDLTVEADPSPADKDQGAFSVAVGDGTTEILFLCPTTSCRVQVVVPGELSVWWNELAHAVPRPGHRAGGGGGAARTGKHARAGRRRGRGGHPPGDDRAGGRSRRRHRRRG